MVFMIFLKVRLCVLDIVSLFVEKKGEAYLSVLPDSVPLLAEALEDDDVKVEEKGEFAAT